MLEMSHESVGAGVQEVQEAKRGHRGVTQYLSNLFKFRENAPAAILLRISSLRTLDQRADRQRRCGGQIPEVTRGEECFDLDWPAC